MTTTQEAPAGPLAKIALTAVAVPAVGALTFMALFGIGPLALFIVPSAALAVLYLYRLTVQSTHSTETRTAAREVGAIVLSVALGFGTWVAMAFLGVMTGILPFMSYRAEDHPFMDEWAALSQLVAVVAVPLSWWLLRRWSVSRR